MNTVYVLGVGRHREFALRTLENSGFRVRVVDLPSNVPVSYMQDAFFGDPKESGTLDAVLADANENDVLITWDELVVEATQVAARRVRTPRLMSPALVRNKYAMRRALASAGLRVPSHVYVANQADLNHLRLPDFPVVVKPVDYGGSGGVTVVSEERDLVPAFAWAQSKTGHGVMIEEFVEGPEFSLEAVVCENRSAFLGITQKFVTPLPLRFEAAHIFPALDAPIELRRQAEEMIRSVADAVGIRAAAMHLEVLWAGGEPYIVEVAARLGGDYIPELVYLSSGVNPYLLEVQAVEGSMHETRVPVLRHAGVRFYYPDRRGKVEWPNRWAPTGNVRVVHQGRWVPAGVEVPGTITSIGSRLGCEILTGTGEELAHALGERDGGPRIQSA